MWYIAKGLQIIGLAQVLGGLFIGISQDDLAAELKIAIIGVVILAWAGSSRTLKVRRK